MLAETLKAEIIHTDDFAAWDNSINWYPALIETVFMPIRNGVAHLDYQPSKWWENHFPDPVVNQPVTPVMILEGVTALRTEFRPFLSLGIFVGTPVHVCLQRGIERDKSTGKSVAELTDMWMQWIAAEEAYIDRDNPQEYADIVLDGTVPFAEQVKF